MKLLTRLLVPALLLAASLAHAQTAADSLKGRIWTATARRIWADTKPRAPLPPAWPTYAAFNSWLGEQGNGEKSGIGLLRGDVARQLGTGRPATAAQVASAILAEAANPPRSRAWLGKLDQPALQAALRQLVPQATLPPLPAADSTRATPGAAPLATNDSTLTAPLPADAATTGSEVGFFGHHPLLAGVLGAVLGGLLTYVLLRSMRRRSRHRRPSSSTEAAFGAATLHSSPQDSAEVLRLQNEVQRLVHYIKELEGKLLHYENGNAADAALTADAPALEPPVAPAELPHPPVAEAPAADSAAPAARYGPVPETPYLEARKLVDEPLPQLALLLLPDPDQPDQADFTLNPQVNQAMLIGDGLDRLQHFFDYDAPPGRISLVEGAAPGRLQRQGDGWQVLERGWLHIS